MQDNSPGWRPRSLIKSERLACASLPDQALSSACDPNIHALDWASTRPPCPDQKNHRVAIEQRRSTNADNQIKPMSETTGFYLSGGTG
jgi:hypothetical protein